MNSFTIQTSLSAITVFVQGLLSFFSPCVLPLVPLYVSYLAGGAKTVDENGNIRYPRRRVMVNTLFFVLGVSATFFVLGLGVTALGQLFQNSRLWLARIGGVIMILFGIYQLGIFGQSGLLSREVRLPFNLNRWAMSPLPAFLLGFTFSFAWTPCVGPTLGSVLLMAGSAGSRGAGFALIAVYTLGFILPFLAVGLFTGTVLDFFKKHQGVVRYTVKIGAVLLILMGIMTLTGFMDSLTGGLAGIGTTTTTATAQQASESAEPAPTATAAPTATPEPTPMPAPDFTLVDQNGEEHTLSDYKGKTVFLNFWATWCPPCRSEMPEIQQLYEQYEENGGDVVVLGLASPNYGREGSAEDIAAFLEENGYSFPVVMDDGGLISGSYGVSAFPTTWMIDAEGNLYGYVTGAMTLETMQSIVEQTAGAQAE